MSEDIDIFKCLDYIRDNAPAYAQAKATRLHLEQYRKSLKALKMNQSKGAQHIRESFAYADPEYIVLLENYKNAVEEETKLLYLMKCAEDKIEVWRTMQANNRFIDKAHT